MSTRLDRACDHKKTKALDGLLPYTLCMLCLVEQVNELTLHVEVLKRKVKEHSHNDDYICASSEK